MNCPEIVSLIDRRLWHPLTWNYVPADPGVWLFAAIGRVQIIKIIIIIKIIRISFITLIIVWLNRCM